MVSKGVECDYATLKSPSQRSNMRGLLSQTVNFFNIILITLSIIRLSFRFRSFSVIMISFHRPRITINIIIVIINTHHDKLSSPVHHHQCHRRHHQYSSSSSSMPWLNSCERFIGEYDIKGKEVHMLHAIEGFVPTAISSLQVRPLIPLSVRL